MSGRPFALPTDPSLEYYRKQARQLHRAYAADEPDAVSRAIDVLGDRAAERFLLSDAQFVLAREHGFRTWPEFRDHIRNQGNVGRPVPRFTGLDATVYARQADRLLSDLHRRRPDALRRLRAYVPRHATTSDGAAAELPDARLVIAREFGFPTWRELLSYAERARREDAERRRAWRRLAPQVETLVTGDTTRLADVTAEQADSLLHILTDSRAIGFRLEEELGVPRDAVDVLIGRATDLDLPLVEATRRNRVEYVRLLLAAGADPGTRKRGPTPLEYAIYHGHTAIVDLLAAQAIVPSALWTYAACGRVDLVRACFEPDGRLRPEAAATRSNFADVGLPSRPPPATEDPQGVLGEALVHACQHGRVDTVRWLLDHGVHPDTTPYCGQTGLHWAIASLHIDVIRLLLERGADPAKKDELVGADADGWLHFTHVLQQHDPETELVHDLIQASLEERRTPGHDQSDS